MNGNGLSKWFTPADLVKGAVSLVFLGGFLFVLRDDIKDLEDAMQSHVDQPAHVDAWRAIGSLEAQVEDLKRREELQRLRDGQ